MSYQVFARKYRPLTFDDVLGQDHVVQTLKNAIEHNRLAHAYLFVGPRGTGKTSTARIFAKALNCSGGPKVNFDPHEDICEEIAEGRSLDVLEIDGASNRGIDHIRDLRDNVRFAPSRGNFRIVYIDEVHMLTKESFNALLKTLEEPPAHVKFIFATTEPHKILPTILSRCQRFDLRPIPSEIIANHLLHIASNEGVSLSKEAAFAVAKVADGGMRDAQSMLDQLVSFCGNHIEEEQVLHIFGITSRETVANALKLILSKELPPLLQLIHDQSEAGRDMNQLLSEIISAVREILVSKVDSSANFDSLPESSKEELAELVKRTHTDKILRLVEVLAETEDKMRWSTNKRLHLEMGLIKAVHALAEASISDIIMALEGAPLPTTQATLTQQKADTQPPVDKQTSALPPQQQTSPDFSTKTDTRQESHLMDPIPDFSAKKDSSPSIEVEQETSVFQADSEEQPAPSQESAPTQRPEEPQAYPEEQYFEPLASTPPTPEKQDSPTIEGSIPLQRPVSAISDDPVAPPDSTEPSFMDPEENLPPEKRTSSFFDKLINTPSPTIEASPAVPKTTEPQITPNQTTGKTLTAEDWQAALEQATENFPLQADFLTNGVFVGHEGIFVTIAFHPNDHQGMDSLGNGPLKATLETELSRRSHAPVSINIRRDSSIPEPVKEELEPLPTPEVTPAPATPSKQPQEKSSIPAPSPDEKEEEDNSYYTDPLIDDAMEIFRARIISQ